MTRKEKETSERGGERTEKDGVREKRKKREEVVAPGLKRARKREKAENTGNRAIYMLERET